MRELALVALGGAIGSVARVLTGGLVYSLVSPRFPWGTATVNVLGSFVFGIVAGAGAARGGLPDEVRAFVLAGLLGGFTTFSAFSYETFELVERGFTPGAALNVAGQVVVSVCALWAGLQLGRSL